MTARYDPIFCPADLEDTARMIHSMLDHCEYGEHIMAIGSILRFLEDFDDRSFSHYRAYIVAYGKHEEWDDLVNVVSVEVHDDHITFGWGEHFSPGPPKDDLNLAYDRFQFGRGEPVNALLIDDWVASAQSILENVQKIDGSF